MRAAVIPGKTVEFGKDWVGQSVNARYPLQQYLGGSDTTAVFATQLPTGAKSKAAIKLVAASASDGEVLVANWKRAAQLSHPHLLQVLDGGRCWLSGRELFYVVTEFADENLAQVLPHRGLTTGEADVMLRPTVSALSYLHEQGLVHCELRPANVMAAGDQLKLSTDAVCSSGAAPKTLSNPYGAPEVSSGQISPATDIWDLGATLVEALTQRAPSAATSTASLPKPFAEIVSHCLVRDPAKRWTIGDVAAAIGVRSSAPKTAETKPSDVKPETAEEVSADESARSLKLKPLVIALLLVAAVIAVLFAIRGTDQQSTPNAQTETTRATQPTATSPAPQTDSAPKPTTPAAANGVVHRVLPDPSASALRTIQGHIKVRMRLSIDSAGNVSDARFTSAGPSKYFSRLSMEAARQWKFTPSDGAREWNVLFEFTQRGVEAIPEPAR